MIIARFRGGPLDGRTKRFDSVDSLDDAPLEVYTDDAGELVTGPLVNKGKVRYVLGHIKSGIAHYELP